MRHFFLFLFFLIFVSSGALASEVLSPEEYNLALMKSDASAQCYTKQGGDALFIFPSSGKITDQTEMAKLFCARVYYPNDYPMECVETISKKIITLSSKETACNYAPDIQKCNTCATIIGLKQNAANYGMLGFFALPLISLFYLLVVGGFYLLKKRLIGPKWLLILTALILIASILLFLYFEL